MAEVRTLLAKHIFFDVVGFTRDRSVEAQSDIIARLNGIVLKAVDRVQIPADRLIFLPTGDGICVTLLEINEPFDISILLAKAIVQGVFEHNTMEHDEQRKFQIRVGVNENVDNLVQDVNDRRNIAGQGINIAQRTMNCADGGQILVGQTVYEVLRSRERYMKSFRQFSAMGKHDLHFNVYQYLEANVPGLNTDVPSLFAQRPKAAEVRLSPYQGYYLAIAHLHYDFLFSQKDMPQAQYAATILLHYLAADAVDRREAGKYGSPRGNVWQSGEASFEEQFSHYAELEFYVLPDFANLVERFYLSDISFCFEKMDYGLPSYIFLNDIGKAKLRSECAEIVTELGITLE